LEASKAIIIDDWQWSAFGAVAALFLGAQVVAQKHNGSHFSRITDPAAQYVYAAYSTRGSLNYVLTRSVIEEVERQWFNGLVLLRVLFLGRMSHCV
jgi:hypothetical protein